MSEATIAIVGFGQIGSKHAEAIAKAEGCALFAVCDPSAEARQRANSAGIRAFATIAELLAGGRPDGIIVATHTQSHVDVATACVQHRIPCLVEKPFAVSATEARQLLASAAQRGVPLLTGHHRRHNPLVQRARDLLAQGAIGRLVGVSVIWALRKHNSYYEVPWRTQAGAGPILTNLIHDVDSLRYICGEIASVQALAGANIRGHAVEDTATIALAFENGAMGSVLVTDAGQSPWAWEVNSGENPDYPRAPQNSYFFTGTDAALGFPNLELWRHRTEDEAHWFKPVERTVVEVPPRDPLVEQASHFARVISGAEPPKVSGREGARTVACIEAIFRSAESGRRTEPDFSGL